MAHWQDLARTLERGLFDGVFLADVAGVYDVYGGNPDTALRTGMQVPVNDPFTLVPVMAAATEHLCFGVTGTIPYEPPFAFARKLSSLDHLTDGRIAWNVVTGYLDSAARGAGQAKQEGHDTRYEIAADYMDVVYKLWEGSWEDDAVAYDKAGGVFTDPARVHEVAHESEWFQMRGVHLCEPSPQRTPVIFQAGASAQGQAFAARHAECVFVGGALPDLVASLREQAAAAGRQREDLKIFSMAAVIVAESDEAAEAKLRDYAAWAQPEGALALMSGWSGVDLSRFDLDARAENLESEAIQSALTGLGLHTVREWGERLSIGGGAEVVVGSPTTVVDQLEEWVEAADLDGFNLAYTVLPECFEDFVDLVVPELQRRGRYKKAYAEGTMREKLFGRRARLEGTHPAAGWRTSA